MESWVIVKITSIGIVNEGWQSYERWCTRHFFIPYLAYHRWSATCSLWWWFVTCLKRFSYLQQQKVLHPPVPSIHFLIKLCQRAIQLPRNMKLNCRCLFVWSFLIRLWNIVNNMINCERMFLACRFIPSFSSQLCLCQGKKWFSRSFFFYKKIKLWWMKYEE